MPDKKIGIRPGRTKKSPILDGTNKLKFKTIEDVGKAFGEILKDLKRVDYRDIPQTSLDELQAIAVGDFTYDEVNRGLLRTALKDVMESIDATDLGVGNKIFRDFKNDYLKDVGFTRDDFKKDFHNLINHLKSISNAILVMCENKIPTPKLVVDDVVTFEGVEVPPSPATPAPADEKPEYVFGRLNKGRGKAKNYTLLTSTPAMTKGPINKVEVLTFVKNELERKNEPSDDYDKGFVFGNKVECAIADDKLTITREKHDKTYQEACTISFPSTPGSTIRIQTLDSIVNAQDTVKFTDWKDVPDEAASKSLVNEAVRKVSESFKGTNMDPRTFYVRKRDDAGKIIESPSDAQIKSLINAALTILPNVIPQFDKVVLNNMERRFTAPVLSPSLIDLKDAFHMIKNMQADIQSGTPKAYDEAYHRFEKYIERQPESAALVAKMKSRKL